MADNRTTLQRALQILDEKTKIEKDTYHNEQFDKLKELNPTKDDIDIESMLVLDDEAKMRMESESLFRALAKMLRSASFTGQVLLAGMWKAKINKMSRNVNESATVFGALLSKLGDNVDVEYIKSMARVVEIFDEDGKERTSIFQYVYDREEAGNPVKDPDTGKIITLLHDDDEFHVNLISSAGIISKLKENAYHFALRLKTQEDRDQLLYAIASGKSREFVKAVKEKQKSDSAPAHMKIKEVEKDGIVTVSFLTPNVSMPVAAWKKMKKRFEGIFELEF